MPFQTTGLAAASLFRRAKLLLFSTTAPPRVTSSSVLFSTVTQTQTPPPTAHFMTQYLISNCGFSPSNAAKCSKRLSHLNSPAKPDAALRFLRGLGFSGASLRSVISRYPPILAANVDKTLEPKVASLRSVGFSDADIKDLVAGNSALLHLNFLPKIQLLDAYLPSKADLLKALRRDPTLLKTNITASVVPNVALLRAHGVAESDIVHALISLPWLLTRKSASFKELVDRVVGLGFPVGRSTFLHALHALNRLSKETFRSKVDMMTSSWWSEAEFHGAFRKAPNIMGYSTETLRTKMRFLVEEAGLEPGYIAEQPNILNYNLEKRLVPRHRVLQILKAEGLPGSEVSLSWVATFPEEKFLKIYVLPYLDRAPALLEIYPDAVPNSGRVAKPLEQQCAEDDEWPLEEKPHVKQEMHDYMQANCRPVTTARSY